ncbi:flagellar basal-body MS-ring/collar protein FliF [Acetanaerobacterium elongatum]|uniref:Flagellar M-ring protein n=1 Tax=Acetanaerobacterium elongatum TaxID=258515 RepID=A0A1G9ZGU8_9FIRM|nr:flagellar basal-body MS-ring/collar protein FliF [Acetanaerobacterium elongatum]SDN20474.1 flagellar M-ring protein FliF [Acetanaerobacterium elongatum]
MEEQLKKILASAKEFWNKQSKKQKIIFFSVLGGIAVLAAAITLILNIDDYVVISSGLDAAQSSEVVSMLQEMNVDVQVDNGGAIKVPKKRESEVLMKLSIAGYPKDKVNYNIFASKVGFTSTQFEQNQYLRFQTEENIRSSIKTIPGVKDASVNIAPADNNDYVLTEEKVDTKASAKVDMYPGYELTSAQVKGIESLIANSVTGLKVENVSVLDNNGKLLTANDEESGETNKLKLSYERQVEDSLKQKALEILKGPFGTNNVSVAVTAVLDYNKMISEEMSYVPSNDIGGIISHEETSSAQQTEGNQGGVAGVENNAEVPTYPNVVGSSGSNSASGSRSVDYLVSYIKTQKEKNGAERKAVTISVMINREVMTDEERTSLQSAVAMAAGVEPANVNIVNMKFQDQNVITPQLNTNMILIVGIAVLALAILLIIVITLLARNHRRKRDLMDMVAAGGAQIQDINQYFGKQSPEDQLGIQQPKPDVSVAKLEVAETKEMALKREIQSFSSDNPDIAAQLLRTWLKGDDDDGHY